jgi:uncharacterized protein (DUF1330 family)
MAAYVIVEIETTDPELMAEYRTLATPTVAAHGGRYLARGGRTDVLEGDRLPGRVVVMEFESLERARAWWESEEYRAARKLRQRAGRTTMISVEGMV